MDRRQDVEEGCWVGLPLEHDQVEEVKCITTSSRPPIVLAREAIPYSQTLGQRSRERFFES